MKKMIMLLALLTFGYTHAQEKNEAEPFGFAKGNLFLEGELSISSAKGTETDEGVEDYENKISSTIITPKIGYFISDRFAAGVGLTYANGKGTITELLNDGTTAVKEDKTNGFGAEVFARYYFLKLGKRFQTYSELSAGFGSLKIESIRNGVSEEGKMKTANANLDLGINYFITPKLAVSFTMANILNYNTLKIESNEVDSSGKSTNFSANLNVFKNFFEAPTFGLLYKF